MSVCDYQFGDEDLSEMTSRLKEMLDIDVADQDLDTLQEITAEIIETREPAGGDRVWIYHVVPYQWDMT